MRILFKTRDLAFAAAKSFGDFYLSSADDRSNLDLDCSLPANFTWSGEVNCYRNNRGDIFAFWES